MRPCAGGFGGQSNQFSQSAPDRNGQQAGRDWIGAGRAALGLGLDSGSDGYYAQLLEPAAREPRTASTISGQSARVGQVGRWAQAGRVGTGQEAPACNGR